MGKWWFVGSRGILIDFEGTWSLWSHHRETLWGLYVCEDGTCRVYPPDKNDHKTYPDFETAQVALRLQRILK